MSDVNTFTVMVELLGYDVLVVDAEDNQGAVNRVREVLRAEQKYQQATFRPALAVIKSIRMNPNDVENLSRRGRDPLEALLMRETHDDA